MAFFTRGVMGARIGSVTLLVLLIGLAYCQASRDQLGSRLTSEASSTKTSSVDTSINNTGANDKSGGASTTTTTWKGESEDFETDDALDESGHIKFENLRATVQEGVLDGPSPSPSSAFSILPSLVTPAVALALSFGALAAKAL